MSFSQFSKERRRKKVLSLNLWELKRSILTSVSFTELKKTGINDLWKNQLALGFLYAFCKHVLFVIWLDVETNLKTFLIIFLNWTIRPSLMFWGRLLILLLRPIIHNMYFLNDFCVFMFLRYFSLLTLVAKWWEKSKTQKPNFLPPWYGMKKVMQKYKNMCSV